ncbi:butyryl-CoA dehydrogenase, partial [Nitriliruptoraceae bacterium ZYF776]|nr:butyryl-CoA dehydrogenase [Profundirhabdus halotolerans]
MHAPLRPSLVDTDVPWTLTDEHRAWRRAVREFCEDVVRPGAAERSIEHRYDPDLAVAMGEMGLYGLLVPAEYGGMGGDLASMCIAIEELARVDSSAAVTAHVQVVDSTLIAELGNEAQKQALLPTIATGEIFVAFGLTEPSGGSDAANVSTRAVRDGDEWVINGSKQFITNSGTATTRYVLTAAATGEGPGGRPEVSLLLVPTDADGVTVAPAYSKLGWRASDTRPLFFQDVRVPADAMVGERGAGLKGLLGLLTWARISIAAMSVGLAQGCLEQTREFVSTRESFGQGLHEHQSIAFSVAEIAAMTYTARTVTYDACWK